MTWMDTFTGCLCVVICIAFNAMYVMTDKKHRIWPNVPAYVRVGFVLTSCGMLARGIDFIHLSTPAGGGLPGHIDKVGIVVTVAMAYTMSGLAFWMFRRTYPAQVWAGMNHNEHLALSDPTGTLAILSMKGARVSAPNDRSLPPL